MFGFDFSAYTVGASKQFEHIGSSKTQEVSELYASKRRTAKRRKLKWRKSFGDTLVGLGALQGSRSQLEVRTEFFLAVTSKCGGGRPEQLRAGRL